MTLISKKLERVQLTDTQIKLVMPQRVLHQIKHLCKEISLVEWSGVLFYSVEGSIRDPENMILTLEDILPMNKGTAAYTEYTLDERVINHRMDTEESDDWKMGHIHSHNSMAVYFSGTDWEELEDNSPNHNFYLSLIVNNKMDFCAKVSFIIESDSEGAVFEAKDENGQVYQFNTEEVNPIKLVTYDCEIVSPMNIVKIDEAFDTKVKGIIEADRKAKAALPKTIYGGWQPKNKIPVGGYRIPSRASAPTVTPRQRQTGWNDDWKFEQEVQTTQEEVDEKLEEEFCLFVINNGNDTHEFTDIEDVIEYYQASKMTPAQLSSTILKNYVNIFQNFFIGHKDKETPEFFEKKTESVLENLEGTRYTTKSTYVRDMLAPVSEGLNSMLTKFQKHEPEAS